MCDSSFSHWQIWRAVRGLPLFLTGNIPREDEEEQNEFVHAAPGERQISAVEAELALKRERFQLEREQLALAKAQLGAAAMQSTQHAASLQGVLKVPLQSRAPWRTKSSR